MRVKNVIWLLAEGAVQWVEGLAAKPDDPEFNVQVPHSGSK